MRARRPGNDPSAIGDSLPPAVSINGHEDPALGAQTQRNGAVLSIAAEPPAVLGEAHDITPIEQGRGGRLLDAINPIRLVERHQERLYGTVATLHLKAAFREKPEGRSRLKKAVAAVGVVSLTLIVSKFAGPALDLMSRDDILGVFPDMPQSSGKLDTASQPPQIDFTETSSENANIHHQKLLNTETGEYSGAILELPGAEGEQPDESRLQFLKEARSWNFDQNNPLDATGTLQRADGTAIITSSVTFGSDGLKLTQDQLEELQRHGYNAELAEGSSDSYWRIYVDPLAAPSLVEILDQADNGLSTLGQLDASDFKAGEDSSFSELPRDERGSISRVMGALRDLLHHKNGDLSSIAETVDAAHLRGDLDSPESAGQLTQHQMGEIRDLLRDEQFVKGLEDWEVPLARDPAPAEIIASARANLTSALAADSGFSSLRPDQQALVGDLLSNIHYVTNSNPDAPLRDSGFLPVDIDSIEALPDSPAQLSQQNMQLIIDGLVDKDFRTLMEAGLETSYDDANELFVSGGSQFAPAEAASFQQLIDSHVSDHRVPTEVAREALERFILEDLRAGWEFDDPQTNVSAFARSLNSLLASAAPGDEAAEALREILRQYSPKTMPLEKWDEVAALVKQIG